VCSLLDMRLDWLHRSLCGILGIAFRGILGGHIGNRFQGLSFERPVGVLPGVSQRRMGGVYIY
jgi:hypothetical protein